MEKSSKGGKEDFTETLHQLLLTKDNINSKLLEETKHNSDLTHQMSIAENQLRELTENALKNLRSQFEKKQKHAVPGIKRLEEALKELKKSERALNHKTQHKGNRNSEIKRAKRRIKDAEKILKEIPKADCSQSVYEAVIHQVTHLCQRLMQIPLTLSFHGNNLSSKMRTVSTSINNDSDETDTDHSDEDTNGSKAIRRPRANSDTTAEIKYPTYHKSSRSSPSVEKVRLKKNGIEKNYRNSPALSSPFEEYKSYLEKFSEIGYMPNDSESSDGSLRSDSPGPLRGYPLSIQRRPSSASRVERHSHYRDRASSLPLLNSTIRRCYTPTPTSNGNSFTAADIHASSRCRSLNGGTAPLTAFGRRDRLDTEFLRSSPLDRQHTKDRTDKPKTSLAAHQHLNKDDILTSYQRNVESLVKGRSHITSPSDTQNKYSSRQQCAATNKPGPNSRTNADGLIAMHKFETASMEKESESNEISSFFENSKTTENGNSPITSLHRLTPKRLLPKVPSVYSSNEMKGSIHRKENVTSIVPRDEKPTIPQNSETQSSPKHETTPKTEVVLSMATSDKCIKSAGIDIGSSGQLGTMEEKENSKKSITTRVTENKPRTNRANACLPGLTEKSISKRNEFDIEEIKFKENVRTARREIIDKLRSKYALPRTDHISEPDKRTTESIKSEDIVSTVNRDQSERSDRTILDESISFDLTSKTELFVKNVPLVNAPERHSPVMSIAGLKRYKSTSNLSKLESFDKATSKFDDKEINITNDISDKTKIDIKCADVSAEENKSDANEPADRMDNLSKSLTFHRHNHNIVYGPMDRQGLIRSTSAENVDVCQFVNGSSSPDHLSMSLNNDLKESGISTLSSDEINLNNTREELSESGLRRYTEKMGTDETFKATNSSSDNDFDSGEGLGNESLDDLDRDSVDNVGDNATKSHCISPNLYPAKLILIDKPNDKSTEKKTSKSKEGKCGIFIETSDKTNGNRVQSHDLVKSSNVQTTVAKLESVFPTRSRPEKRTLKQFKENSKDRKIHFRSRSASASRNPASVYSDNSPTSPKALFPRNRFGSDIESSDNGTNVSSFLMPVKKSRSIEADLNKICQEETAESIRREWIQRRSATLRKTIPMTATAKKTSIFEYDKSVFIPIHSLRSRLSGMVFLQNGKYVLLDELQMEMYLLNAEFRIVSKTSLEYIPSGICMTGSNSFAIAFPYKCLVRVFYVVKDRITHTRDIRIGCNEWITDLNNRKGRLLVLCKGGHIHILGITGKEEGTINVGVIGKLQTNEAGNRFYIYGENKIARFNDKGEMIWSKSDISASCLILYNDKLYIADSDRKKIITLSEIGDTRDLVSSDTGSVSAACFSQNADELYLCQYSEEFDDENTKRISVYKKGT